jgi:rubrerythrin
MLSKKATLTGGGVMSVKKSWWDWWRGFLGFSSDGRRKAIEILQQQYIEANQSAARFSQHARRMQYPQFREKLLRIAADESKHSDWIAEKIRRLGGALPAVQAVEVSGGNSWQALLADLEEERRAAAEFWDEVYELGTEFPDVVELLQRVYEDGKIHRAEIMEMLIRSDPQALWAA